MEILWEKSIILIQEKLSQQNFETWIRPIKVASLEGNQIHLSVPNKFFKDWLMENYRTVITDVLSAVSGVALIVNFLIGEDGGHAPAKAHVLEKTTPVPKKPARLRIHPSLKQNYNFERFVVGASNQFAHAAATAVARAAPLATISWVRRCGVIVWLWRARARRTWRVGFSVRVIAG